MHHNISKIDLQNTYCISIIIIKFIYDNTFFVDLLNRFDNEQPYHCVLLYFFVDILNRFNNGWLHHNVVLY